MTIQAKERVLVADDDEGILFLLATTLEMGGYQVTTALDGQKALDILRNSPPFAVLLTDLMMPIMGGLALMREARKFDPLLEIIIVTAAGSMDSAISALRDGHAWDYLLKPLDSLQQLNLVVTRAVAHRHLVMESAAEAERLRALVTAVSEAILTADANGIITVANPAIERLLGRSGLSGQALQEVLPPRLVGLVRNWQMIGAQQPASIEIHWNNDSQLMVNLTPLPTAGEESSGWVMVLRDITQFKQQEKLKTQAMAQMLAQIRVPMAAAMSAIVDLNAHLSHDEKLSDKVYRLSTIWEKIQAWGEELTSMVQGDAAYSLKAERVNVAYTLHRICQTPRVLAFQKAGGKVLVQTEKALPAIYTDPNLFHKFLFALVQRAISRSPQSGAVSLRARAEAGQVWIEICDDGPQTADAAGFSSESAGSGLELANARSLLDRLDGQLWFSGGCMQGNNLTVCLPAAPP